jgi:hypothetical protein
MMWIAKSGQKMLIDPGTLPYWQSLGWTDRRQRQRHRGR